MEKLELRMRQALIKVDERVARFSKMAVMEKSRPQKLIEVDRRGSKKTEKPVVKMLQRVQRVRNALRDALRLRLGPLPCLRDDGEVSVPASASQRNKENEDSDSVYAKLEGGDHSPAALALKDGGDGPRELDAVPRAQALWMDMTSCYIPDHDEDAFFCHPGAGVVGVVDGVGGYRKRGVDAHLRNRAFFQPNLSFVGAFARALIANAFAEAKRAFTEGGAPVCPYTLLRSAHEEAARSLTPGASTAVIVSLDGATLRWACVSDSAFAVLRGGRIVHRSRPQEHRFNCPYQLSATGADRVADADVGGMPVVDGDVVVIGTDGLFDNVLDVELEHLVRKGTELGLSLQNMADNIAATACEISFGWLVHSPSTSSTESWRNNEEGAERFYGGKVDDITVVVAFIVSSILLVISKSKHQATKMTRVMETLQPIQETLIEIKKRTPEVRVAKFVAKVLLPLGTKYAPSAREDGDARHQRRAERPDAGGARPCALRMDWAACVLPRHGEDAHFGHAEAGFIGVADGVGGYRDHGVDAGAFARELMANALAKVELAADARRLRPKDVLERAYETAVMKATPGASTAVILSLDRTTLRWAYIGDSAFAVLRGGKIVYRSVPQQRRFNYPYQLSSDGRGDSLAKAMVGGLEAMRDGDVVVAGTDGLFDNLHDGQLERAVQMGTELGFSSKNMADMVAGIAYDVSESERACSPYSLGCWKAYGERGFGGKKDDITVIVAYIVSKDS
ncbi:putative protein phosphatase 2C 23 [Dichanthelium oligosanthes]|uniref:Protein phosphatase n=1 Tax=Dichanthelium oligosanthes TaxID=888268 RepID=A0A1E5V6V5_9POAL|nr:putative protein phosphatase 2C 23 [Dichanthelium oligosanthes]